MERLPSQHIFQARPCDGEYLKAACLLDAACPNFLNSLLHATTLKRQAIFLALVETDFERPQAMAARLTAISTSDISSPDPFAVIGKAMTLLRPQQIIKAVFGHLPTGLVGLLARLGYDPLYDPSLYGLAFDLFAEPPNRPRAKLLGQIEGRISANRLRVIARLDPLLLSVAVVQRVRNLEAVEGLHQALALIRRTVPSATDSALAASLDGLSPKDTDMSRWIKGWLGKAEHLLLSPPVPANDPDLRPILPRDLEAAGQRLENCLETKLGYVSLGSRLYLEWTRHQPGAVVELRALSGGGWVVEQICGHGNGPLGAEVRAAILAKLSSLGVHFFVAPGQGRAGTKMARLLGIWDDFDLTAEPIDDGVEDVVAGLAELFEDA